MKKILALVLALTMLLPALGVADVQTAIDEAYANGKAIDTMLGVLLDESLVGAETAALVNDFYATVTVQKEPQQLALALMYGENQILCLEVEPCENGVYLHSNALGEKPLFLAEKDLNPLAERVAKYAVDNGMMTQEEADAVLANMQAMTQTAQAPAQTEESDLTEAEQEQIMEVLVSIDMAPLMDQLSELLDKIEIVEDNIVQPDADKAAMMIRAEFNGEDLQQLLKAVLKTVESSDALVSLLANAGYNLKDESVRSTIDTMIDQTAVAVKSLGFEAYLGEDGGVVYLASKPVFASEGNEMTVSVSYKRNTLENGKRYTLDIGAGAQPAEGEYAELFNATMMLEAYADGGKLSFKSGDQELIATVTSAEGVQDGGEYGTCQIEIEALVAGESAGKATFSLEAYDLTALAETPSSSHSITLTLNDGEPCVTAIAVSSAEEPAQSISVNGVVEPMALNEEEFNAFLNGVIESVATWANNMAETFSGAEQQAN